MVSLTEGKHAIGCRWMYKIKHNVGLTVEWYKSKLVAKGYTQQEEINYIDTFFHISMLVTLKLILDLAAKHGWSFPQVDVTNIFFHGDLEEDIHMLLHSEYIIAS